MGMCRYRQYRQRLSAWIAIFAILASSLLPAISHARFVSVANSAVLFAEICSESTPRLHGETASHTSNANQVPATTGNHFDHCPFCLTHAGSFALLPSAELVIPVIEPASLRPSLFFHTHSPLFAWLAAQARAPPVFS